RLEDAFSVQKEIVQACIYDQFGSLFAAYKHEGFEQAECPAETEELSEITSDRAFIMKPSVKRRISGEIDESGCIDVESTLEENDNCIANQAQSATGVIIVGLLICYLLAMNLQKAISEPVLNLTRAARQISTNRD